MTSFIYMDIYVLPQFWHFPNFILVHAVESVLARLSTSVHCNEIRTASEKRAGDGNLNLFTKSLAIFLNRLLQQ